jgi:hypothetical protein
MDRKLTQQDYDIIIAFIHRGMEEGSQLPGMSYEDGMLAVLDVMDSNSTAEEATNQ